MLGGEEHRTKSIRNKTLEVSRKLKLGSTLPATEFLRKYTRKLIMLQYAQYFCISPEHRLKMSNNFNLVIVVFN